MQRRQIVIVLLTAFTSGCLRESGAPSSGDESNSEGGTQSQREAKNFKIQISDRNGTVQTVVDNAGVAAANRGRERNGRYGITITLTEPAAEELVTTLRDVGAFENPSDHPLFIFFDGQTVNSFQLSRSLITTMESGEFLNSPSLVIRVENESIAQNIVDNLQ